MAKLFAAAAIAAIALILIGLVGSGFHPLPSVSAAGLRQFSSQAELESFLSSHKQEAVYGVRALAEGAPAPQAADAGGAADFSPTNIQVAGVDEPDTTKTDGSFLYTLANNKVSILRASPLELVTSLDIPGTGRDLFLHHNRLVVFSSGWSAEPGPYASPQAGIVRPTFTTSVTRILVYDVSDPSKPTLAREFSIDGDYADSRLVGDSIYLIANQWISSPLALPMLAEGGSARLLAPASSIYYLPFPDSSYAFTTILSFNPTADAEPNAKVILRGSAQTIFVSQDNIYLAAPKQPDYRALERRVAEAAANELPADARAKALAALALDEPQRSEQLSAIQKELALTPEQELALLQRMEQAAAAARADFAKEFDKTVIQRIAIANGAITPATVGEVPGHPLNQFSFDEHAGYLRVATTTQPFWGGPIPLRGGSGGIAVATAQAEPATKPAAASAAGSSAPTITPVTGEAIAEPAGPTNNIYVLDAASMATVGRLEGLAPGERIYAARFLGDRAYLVTFVQLDPLFVIDLSNPSAPRVLGELKIPGYSDYLHPVDATHLIGIGKETVPTEWGTAFPEGLKVALFDVSDVAHPTVVASRTFGAAGSDSEALRDHHAFLFSADRDLLVIPAQLTELKEGAQDVHVYGTPSWQGALVLRASTLELRGKVTHDTAQPSASSWFDWTTAVHRSLFISDTLYTVSDRLVKANALADLSELGTAKLPEPAQPEPVPLKGVRGG